MTIQDIISQIVDGNNIFSESHKKEYFESFKTEQRPYITLVTCSDSRVSMNALMRDTSNKIFSIQNIGNQVLSNEGSVDYGVYHLKTPLLMFLGHSDCGAIKACLKGYNKATNGIKRELDFLKPLFDNQPGHLEFDKLHGQFIEKNLDYQVDIACEKYAELITSGKLIVVAGIYDFKGDYDKGQGTLIFINVNRQKGIKALSDLSLFSSLTRDQKEAHIV